MGRLPLWAATYASATSSLWHSGPTTGKRSAPRCGRCSRCPASVDLAAGLHAVCPESTPALDCSEDIEPGREGPQWRAHSVPPSACERTCVVHPAAGGGRVAAAPSGSASAREESSPTAYWWGQGATRGRRSRRWPGPSGATLRIATPRSGPPQPRSYLSRSGPTGSHSRRDHKLPTWRHGRGGRLGPSKPVSGGETTMGGVCSLDARARRVPRQHLPGPPAGEAH